MSTSRWRNGFHTCGLPAGSKSPASPLEGFAPMGELKGDYATDAGWRAAMGPEMVRGAAALAAVQGIQVDRI